MFCVEHYYKHFKYIKHLILTKAVWGWHYYHRSTDEEKEAQRSKFSKSHSLWAELERELGQPGSRGRARNLLRYTVEVKGRWQMKQKK